MTLAPDAVALDKETFPFERGAMAPCPVCLQWGTPASAPDGRQHGVILGRAAMVEALREFLLRSQIWFHNGPFDLAVMLEWFPELADLVWAALEEGRIFDTMWLQRLIQIYRGEIQGSLALDMVCLQWGLRAPEKVQEAEWGGFVYDVRTSFGLFYDWPPGERLPSPWHEYADYDGEVTIQLAERQVERFCVALPGSKRPPVRLEDLAFVTRTYFCLYLARTYGLRVNPDGVAELARAAHSALGRLQEAAILNGFLKPVPATRNMKAVGHTAGMICPVRIARPPKWNPDPAKAAKQRERWDKKQAEHTHCKGCQPQASEAGVYQQKLAKLAKENVKAAAEGRAQKEAPPPPETPTAPAWKLDTVALTAAIVEAFDGNPPLTEPKKDKVTKKMKGGGRVSRSRDTLQDSGNEELERWAEYNEWATLKNKDLKIFAHSPVHTNFSMTNNLRPASWDPNILNFRRRGFLIATCPTCQWEQTVDPKDYEAMKKRGETLPCPVCC